MANPIRIGMVGLSAAATGTSWASAAHLPYLAKSPYFKITALLNSSVENAQKAIDFYNLDPGTKAYGSADDLANDPDVDLVVVNTRVDKHASVLLPSLRAGKDAFSEWPLDGTWEKAKGMVDAAREGGGRTFVGLQGRQSLYVKAIKQMIDSGRIGKVFSSTFIGATTNGGGVEGKAVDYMADRSVGGNILTIQFGHSIDAVFYALGEPKYLNSMLANQRKETKIVDRSTDPPTLIRTVPKDTPDQILLQAQLESGAVLSYHLRGGPPMPASSNTTSGDTSTLTPTPQGIWRIYGELGEIEVTASGSLFNVGYPDTVLRVHDHASNKTEIIEVEKDELSQLPTPAQNIGRVYDRIAEIKGVKPSDRTSNEDIVDFQGALERHKLIEATLKHWDDNNQGWSL